jgi:hypothetical protein
MFAGVKGGFPRSFSTPLLLVYYPTMEYVPAQGRYFLSFIIRIEVLSTENINIVVIIPLVLVTVLPPVAIIICNDKNIDISKDYFKNV